MTVSVD